jgi:hypothetical protein
MYNSSVATFKNKLVVKAVWQPNFEHYLIKLRRNLKSKSSVERPFACSILSSKDLEEAILDARDICSRKDDKNKMNVLECKIAWDIVEEMSAAMYDMKMKEDYYRDD